MKKATVLLLILTALLVFASCSGTEADKQGNEIEIAGESDNKSEASASGDESSQDSDNAEDKEQSFSDLYPNTDIFFELDLEDGKFYEIPRLSEEKETEFIQSDNCAESIRARLESYGVFLNPDVITEDFYLSMINYSFLPMFFCHYQDFDFLYVRYPGYRGYNSGNMYIFENSMLKRYISDINEIDLDNAFRTMGDNIWLVKMNPGGGSGMAVEGREWINLTKEDMPSELYYTNYYGSSNYRYGHDIDFEPIMEYSVSEEELYINEQNIPVLKVCWQKEVYVEKEPSGEGKIISLTATGYDEYAIDAPKDCEDFDPFALSCGELLDGLEEQLNELINHGTEEEKHIAKQLVDNFATIPNHES